MSRIDLIAKAERLCRLLDEQRELIDAGLEVAEAADDADLEVAEPVEEELEVAEPVLGPDGKPVVVAEGLPYHFDVAQMPDLSELADSLK